MKPLTFTKHRQNCLVSLAQFFYLTREQMIELGITTALPNLQRRVLEPLLEHRFIVKARIKDEDSHFEAYHPTRHIYGLSKAGADWVSHTLAIPPENVYCPPARPKFTKDAIHRSHTISFLIKLRQYCSETQRKTGFVYPYFQNGNSQKGTFHAITRHHFPESFHYTEADLEFDLKTPDNHHLFVFEYHRGNRPKRIMRQLDFHSKSLELGVVTQHYGFHKHPTVLSLYEKEPTMFTVMDRINDEPSFNKTRPLFLFNTYEKIKADFNTPWLQTDRTPISPFPLLKP